MPEHYLDILGASIGIYFIVSLFWTYTVVTLDREKEYWFDLVLLLPMWAMTMAIFALKRFITTMVRKDKSKLTWGK